MIHSSFKRAGVLVASLAFGVAFAGCEEEPGSNDPVLEASDFQVDASGWKIVGDAEGGYIEPQYSSDGGATGGYIFAQDDVAGGVWYFSAPSRYLGNRIDYYGATLRYSAYQESAFADQFDAMDIVFNGPAGQVFYAHDATDYPEVEWTGYAIRIHEQAGWRFGSLDDSVPATTQNMLDVLSDVSAFMIRGEFETGPDSGGLDEVSIRR